MNLQKDLKEFIELFNSHGVEYLVIGGHAVAFHGYPRYTGDIDFLVRPTAENAQRVVASLIEFGFPDAGKLQSILEQPEGLIQLGRPPNRIDIVTSIQGVEQSIWDRAVNADLGKVPVRFIDLESLLKNKMAAGRTKDLADAQELQMRAGVRS